MDNYQMIQYFNADVVIAGAGAAGLMAALHLSRTGKKVIVMEALASPYGSNFAMCGGPAACETKVQKLENENLTSDMLFKYMYDYSKSSVNGKLLKKVIQCTAYAVDSLFDLGIQMELWPDVYENGFRARHFILSKGVDRILPIVAEIEKNNGIFIFSAKAKEPIIHGDKVVGIRGFRGAIPIEVRAQASLICTGGFLGNKKMQQEIYNTILHPLGNIQSDGDGINLVRAAGGVYDRNFAVLGNECGAVSKSTKGWPFTKDWHNKNEHYGHWLFGGLITDINGNRFINEELIARFPLAIGGEVLARQGKAFCIMDAEFYEGVKEKGVYTFLGKPKGWMAGNEADYYSHTVENAEKHLKLAIRDGWAFKADSISEISIKFGLTNLEDTVTQYNEFCKNGVDTEFYKSVYFLKAVQKSPFYAFEYIPSAWGTCGGVKVDASLRALNSDNKPIEGLYVAGVDTGSMYTSPYYINPGSAVGLAMGSGVLAAKEINSFIDGNLQ